LCRGAKRCQPFDSRGGGKTGTRKKGNIHPVGRGQRGKRSGVGVSRKRVAAPKKPFRSIRGPDSKQRITQLSSYLWLLDGDPSRGKDGCQVRRGGPESTKTNCEKGSNDYKSVKRRWGHQNWATALRRVHVDSLILKGDVGGRVVWRVWMGQADRFGFTRKILGIKGGRKKEVRITG